MRSVKTQTAHAVLAAERRLSVWTVRETHFLRRDLQITSEQQPQETAARDETTPVLLEVKPAGTLAFVAVQRVQKPLHRLLQARAPHVYFPVRQRQLFRRR